jgi:aminoglycoside phosphotransferase family enzyme/predicted kinase
MYPPPQELRSLRAENARAGHQKDSFTPYAELKETHASVVFLVGARAFKLKKPVDLGFLDQSTREKRLAACRRELDLNRRLAPDVYLGISDVLGIDGLPEDHLLVMSRMPAQRRLAHLVRSGAELADDLRELARTVAIFHLRCARNAQVSACGTVDAVRRRWQRNFEEAWPFVGVQLDSDAYDDIRSLAENYLRGRGPLFAARIAVGAVVDGHGDLLAEDVFCLPDGPRILDCLEFDSALRCLDRIDDVACLAMDLERLGDPDAARFFLDSYLSISGDRPPASLISHYLAYRAFVRAKVACLPGAAETGGVAEQLLQLARRHLHEAQVSLVLLGGPPGTGKSTVSRTMAPLGVTVLSSDEVRKELAGLPPTASATAPLGQGIYTEAWTARTYEELLARARRLLGLGDSVVLDATVADARYRDQAARLAAETCSGLASFVCDLPEDLVVQRMASRRGSPSDADLSIATVVKERFDDWPSAVVVDTSQPVAAVTAKVMHRLQPWRASSSLVRPRPAAD